MPSSDPHPRRGAAALIAILILPAAIFLAAGCQRGAISQTGDGPSAEELVSFYSPRSIQILPFTKPRSFDDDDIPDVLAVSLRPLDAAGDPVKAYGTFNFVLYSYKQGTADHRGPLLQTWNLPISNLEDQKRFWERVTATYEFPLSWEGNPLPPQQKYILTASYEAPGSERLFSEYEFEFRITREDLINAMAERQKSGN